MRTATPAVTYYVSGSADSAAAAPTALPAPAGGTQ
jgi:hypothetical protein